MKITFLWDWKPTFEQTITWKDGLAAALKLLGERHDLQILVPGDYDTIVEHPYFQINVVTDVVAATKAFEPDVILHWADMTRPHAIEHAQLGIPMALLFAGGEIFHDNTELFDHIFVESQVYLDRLLGRDYSASIAFGTNTGLFKPIPEQAKIFDALAVGTFAIWKRHNLFAEATKDMLAAACGFMYQDNWESECYEVCEKAGNLVLPHLSAEALHRMYAASKVVVLPARSDGGSQRSVLESLAMNIPTIVTDSDKFDYEGVIRVEPDATAIREAIEQWHKATSTNTRQYVLDNWSHVVYADKIEKELLRLCQNR